mmetsp:Transcript_3526/g.12320  ORF Transcript_3526/g.12320 Transcript_3526/m.12320 type:complete len:111 (+) Transcript_3526:3289-3621(+)
MISKLRDALPVTLDERDPQSQAIREILHQHEGQGSKGVLHVAYMQTICNEIEVGSCSRLGAEVTDVKRWTMLRPHHVFGVFFSSSCQHSIDIVISKSDSPSCANARAPCQ